MPTKSKSAIIASMAPVFDKNIADQIIDLCKPNRQRRQPLDPFAEVIDPDRLTAPVYAAWSTPMARDYIVKRLELYVPKAAKPARHALLDEDDDVAIPAAVAILSEHFLLTTERLYARYHIIDPTNKLVERWDVTDAQIPPIVCRILEPILSAAGAGSSTAVAKRAWDLFQANVRASPPVALWGQPDGTEWAFGRPLIHPDASVPFPHLEAFVRRLNDPEAFGAWVWGVYRGVYRGRQVLYVSDETGNSGKSSFFAALDGLFDLYQDPEGRFIRPDIPRVTAAFSGKVSAGSTHSSAAFEGKALVRVGDNANPRILLTQEFKELSGDDPTVVNPKGIAAYTQRFHCKAVITSNHEPDIVGEEHSLSRALWLKLEPLPPDTVRDAAWIESYHAEWPGFLAWAERCFAERCDGTTIAVNQAVKDAVALKVIEFEDVYSVPFAEKFIADPEGRVEAADFAAICEAMRWDEFARKRFVRWLRTNHGVAIGKGGRGGWYLQGVRLSGGSSETTLRPQPKQQHLHLVGGGPAT